METNSIIQLGLAILIISGCKPQYTQQRTGISGPRTVMVEQLTPSAEPIPIEVSGVISSKIEAQLSFKLPGVIERILVEEGQKVRKGQILAHLNLEEINAQVLQAQNAVDKAERDLRRVRNLYRDSVATLEQLQNLETSLEVSQADLRIARFNKQYASIAAPADGKVLKRFVEQGELAAAGSPVLTFGSHGEEAYVMRVSLADVDVVKLIPGDSASIWFDAYPGRKFDARVTEIAEAANPQTGTFEIELTIDPAKLAIKSGFIGKAKIYPSNQAPYYRISMSALVEGHQHKASVYFYDEVTSEVVLSEVQPLHIDDTYFTVSAQELNNEKIVTEGSAYVHPGEIVTPYTSQP